MKHLNHYSGFENEMELLKKSIGCKHDVELPTICNCLPIGPLMPLEYYCLYLLDLIFPLSEVFNGRFGQYLSKCDWF